MNRKTFLICLFLLFSKGVFAQTISLRTVSALPNKVLESSGIVSASINAIWTHNDSGGEPALYNIDTLGNVLRTVIISNTLNTDWEALASDGEHYYIGDFGNNLNSRKDLKIYKVQNPNTTFDDTIQAQVISFHYSNQNQFPPKDANKNFDAEAFVYFDSSLYIFTKNYTSPFTGYTYLYKLPSVAGNYTAELMDSFKLGSGFKEQWWITDADISPDKKKLVLLSSDKMFVFSNFSKADFFKGTLKIIMLGSFTQKEGFSFYSNNEFYITDEYFDLLGGRNLYQGSIVKYYASSEPKLLKPKIPWVRYMNGTDDKVIQLRDDIKSVSFMIMDINGKTAMPGKLNQINRRLVLTLAPGYYTLCMTDGMDWQYLPIFID